MLSGEDGRRLSNAQEVAAVVHARNGVELADGLGCHAAGSEDPGIRHEQIEPAVAAHDIVEAGRRRGFVGHIEGDAEGAPESELGGQHLGLAACLRRIDVG
jgi:hypothetical protein